MTQRPPAQATVHIDNAQTTVTEWRFPAGTETTPHRHTHDYVVVPLSTGTLQIEKDGESHVLEMESGQSYYRSAGIEHNVVNENDTDFRFVEIEFKTT